MAPADEAIEADSAASKEEDDGPSTDGGDQAGATDEIECDDALTDPAQRLAEELESVNDRLLRLAAEFENFRKRTRREQADLSAVAQADLARRLLSTLDDLARVSSTPPETTTVEALDQGLELILRNLRKELEEAGLTRIEALGARFNPEVHQALMEGAGTVTGHLGGLFHEDNKVGQAGFGIRCERRRFNQTTHDSYI